MMTPSSSRLPRKLSASVTKENSSPPMSSRSPFVWKMLSLSAYLPTMRNTETSTTPGLHITAAHGLCPPHYLASYFQQMYYYVQNIKCAPWLQSLIQIYTAFFFMGSTNSFTLTHCIISLDSCLFS